MNKRIIRNVLFAFASLTIIISCKNDEKVLDTGKGKIKIETSKIEFDKINIYETSEKTFTIENIGNASLEIDSIELTGENKDDFKISITTAFSIEEKENKEVKIEFTANSIGQKIAVVTIKTGTETSTINLKAFVKDPNKIFVEGSASENIEDFYIGKYEITNNEFVKFLNIRKAHTEGTTIWIKLEGNEIVLENDVYKIEEGKEKFPARYVSFYGAMEYAKWAEGDIPTYKQWAYAAKGGKESQPTDWIYFGAKDKEALNEIAWTSYNSGRKPKEVGTRKANKLDIYDMPGSVFEWIKLENDEVSKNIGGSYRSSGTSVKVGYAPRLGVKSDMSVNLGFRLVYSAK